MKKTLLVASIGIIVFIAACTKISTTELGAGLIPAVDGVTTFDTTFTVESYNELINGGDSIRTSRYQEHTLGNISNDPLFGTTKATINVEMKPAYYPYGFEVREDSLMLDSAILVLSYVDSWGDSTAPINLSVFELSEKIQADSTYPNYKHFNTGTALSSSKTFDIRRLKDSLHMFKEDAANQIRIPLNTSFGNKLLHTFDSTSSGTNNAYNGDSVFSERFHGFGIVANSGNALLRINLQDTNAKLALYYRYKTRSNALDTVVRYFRPTTISGTSNEIVRNRASGEVNTYLNNGTAQDSLLYIQSGPGLHAKIKVPNLNLFTNRVVHRAELYMEQAPGNQTDDDRFTQPILFLTSFGADSARRFHIPHDIAYSSDGTVSNLASFGGYIVYKNDVATGRRIASYAFDVSRYVQGIITRQEKVYDFYLFAPVFDYVFTNETSGLQYPIYGTQLNPAGVGRVRLLGGNSKRSGKMKLRVIYSKL